MGFAIGDSGNSRFQIPDSRFQIPDSGALRFPARLSTSFIRKTVISE
ncbi:MAG: hypothetical protein IPK58_16495 [Acidobacteria bacterium]|nr:hypothetical protein [Acidobacteriota bacterium]